MRYLIQIIDENVHSRWTDAAQCETMQVARYIATYMMELVAGVRIIDTTS